MSTPKDISFGKSKSDKLLSQFTDGNIFEKGLDTSKLVLKEVNVNGKMQKRWVRANPDDEKEQRRKYTDEEISTHAKAASDEGLRRTAQDEQKPQQLRTAAKEELNRRGKTGDEQTDSKGSDTQKTTKSGDKEAKTETGVQDEGEKQDKPEEPKSETKDNESANEGINRRFKSFERFTRAIAKGKMKSMIAYGSGGVGKTFTVTEEFKKLGKKEFKQGMELGSDEYDYVKITGKATPAAVYQALYEHNGKTIIFDDCDSVLQHDDAINMFKGALDTSGDGTITYGSQRKMKDSNGNEIPSRFDFDGSVVFISNLPADKVPQPLKSRSLRIDMTMTPDETIERIRTIAKDKDGNYQNLKFPTSDGKNLKYTHEEMDEALNFLEEHKNDTEDLNVRTIGSILSIMQEVKEDGGKGDDWKQDAAAMLFSKGLEDEFNTEYDKIMKL